MINIKNIEIGSYLIVIKESNHFKLNEKWEVINAMIFYEKNKEFPTTLFIERNKRNFYLTEDNFKYFIDLKSFRKNKLKRLK